MVTDVERDYLWSTYAADPRARINLGIRRRLASLMDNDRRKIELMNSILLSMPGTPIIYYGDEIGMGDNIYLGDRNGVRTPMQWTPDRNGGFSRCDPAQLYLPLHHGPGVRLLRRQRRGAGALAVLAAELDEAADRRAQVDQGVRPRARSPSSGPPTARCWPMCASSASEAILCVANLSRSAQAVELDLSPWKGRVPRGNARPHALPAHRRPALSDDAAALRLLLVLAAQEAARRAGQRSLPREITTLVLGDGWELPLSGWTQANLRTRRAAGLPAGPALVRRQGVERAAAITRCRRHPDRARRRPLCAP